MKVLVPTSVMPDKKSLRINFILPIISSLQKQTDTQIIWLVYQPDKITSKSPNFDFYDIHDFENALDCLNLIRPDCIMVGKDMEPIQFSLILAAKHLQIPIISFIYQSYDIESSHALKGIDKFFAYSRMLSSNQVPSDSLENHHFLRRLRFIFYKMNFFKNTQSTLQLLNQKSYGFFSKIYINYLRGKDFPINTVSDLYLLPDSSWKKPLTSLGISDEKLSVVGNPILDQLYEKFNNFSLLNSTTDILIVTDALVEHGMCSKAQRRQFLIKILNNLQKNHHTFSFKIHPASEDKLFYQNLLNELGISAKIYQNENFWDIIENYSLVLSFGASTIHTEIALMGVKMVFLDFEFDLPLMPFMKEGITLGNIIHCKNFESLENSITKISKKSNLSESFIQKRNNFVFGFDGKSSQRCSEAILNLLKNFYII